jgi:hypothetical protein
MHIRKYLRPIAHLLEHGLPASMIMQAFDGPLVIPLNGPRHGDPTTFREDPTASKEQLT